MGLLKKHEIMNWIIWGHTLMMNSFGYTQCELSQGVDYDLLEKYKPSQVKTTELNRHPSVV